MFHSACPCLTEDRFSLSGWLGVGEAELFDRIVKRQNEQMSPND